MYSNNDVRNKLVIFYYKCKYNYDRKQKIYQYVILILIGKDTHPTLYQIQ